MKHAFDEINLNDTYYFKLLNHCEYKIAFSMSKVNTISKKNTVSIPFDETPYVETTVFTAFNVNESLGNVKCSVLDIYFQGLDMAKMVYNIIHLKVKCFQYGC